VTARPPCPDVDLLRERDRVIALDRKISDLAFHLGVTKEQLNCALALASTGTSGQGTLDGISSPAGLGVWYVVGESRSVREWAMSQGWNGRPVRQEQARGTLCGFAPDAGGALGCGDTKRTC
jgi:hypothetical protein